MPSVRPSAQPRVRKCALTALVVALVAVALWLPNGVFAQFTSTTTAATSIQSGSVILGANDSGVAMFSTSGMSPGTTVTKCIAVTYTGSAKAQVRLYASGGSGLGAYLTMTLTRGTSVPDPPAYGTGDGCGTFTPDPATYAAPGGVMYAGTLSDYATSYPGYASGLPDPTAGSPDVWTTGTRHVYRVDLTLTSDPAAQGLSVNPTFTWEARNM
jgi:hypothetical protein